MYRYHLIASFDKDLQALKAETIQEYSTVNVEIPILTSSGSFRYGLQRAIDDLRKQNIYPSEAGFDAIILGLLVYMADMKISRINNSENQADQCIWVLSHIKSFDVADKDTIARCVFSFASDNLGFYSNVQPDLFRYLLNSATGLLDVPAYVQSIYLADDGVSFVGSSFN